MCGEEDGKEVAGSCDVRWGGEEGGKKSGWAMRRAMGRSEEGGLRAGWALPWEGHKAGQRSALLTQESGAQGPDQGAHRRCSAGPPRMCTAGARQRRACHSSGAHTWANAAAGLHPHSAGLALLYFSLLCLSHTTNDAKTHKCVRANHNLVVGPTAGLMCTHPTHMWRAGTPPHQTPGPRWRLRAARGESRWACMRCSGHLTQGFTCKGCGRRACWVGTAACAYLNAHTGHTA